MKQLQDKKLLEGNFEFKRLEDKSIDRTVAVCCHCFQEFKYHRSTSSLRYHLTKHHTFVDQKKKTTPKESTTKLQQQKLDLFKKQTTIMDKFRYDTLTNMIANWIASSGRPINIIEDNGLEEIIRFTSCDSTYKLPSRTAIMNRIHSLYAQEKSSRIEMLTGMVAKFFILYYKIKNKIKNKI